MAYRLNQQVDEQEFHRYHGMEREYIGKQRARGLLIEIGNVLVDAEQLALRTFQCNSGYCVTCSGIGAARQYKGSCCTDLQVDVTDEEKRRFTELARLAQARLGLDPADPIGEIVRRILDDRVTRVTAEQEQILRHRRDGRCVMSHLDEGGRLRCAINTLCERLGLPVRDYKADPCYLFPLHYSEYEKGHYLVSILSEETRRWIEQHPCVGKLRCLRTPEAGAPPAYVFLRQELEYLFGREFYAELDRRARLLLRRFRRSRRGAQDGADGRGAQDGADGRAAVARG